jgi:hypothetical protein
MTVAPLERLEAAERVLPPLVVRDDGLFAAAVVSVAVAGLRRVASIAAPGGLRFLLPGLIRGLCDHRIPIPRCFPVAHHPIE